ncbi:MAG TPA: L,D-transpeptidase/peptidoglycan binding protein, partial [Solirubrobacterales bacterium]|nr:L,D-transpeptidase/peptidoglycan binding protein [Solirubrobacterales bacterium]
MGRKTKIAVVTCVVLLLLGAAAAYAYDSSQEDEIAEGVTIAGVDIGGMSEAEAKRAVHRRLIAPLQHSLKVGYDGESWVLPGKRLKLRADLDQAVEDALDASREGGLPTRLVRYVTGDELDKRVSADVTYSQPAINKFVREIAGEVDREPQDASVEASGASLTVVPAEHGRKLRDNLLTDQLNAAVLNADADHTISAKTHSVAPEVTGEEVASEYPSYLTLDRASYTLRLWKDLKLAKTYTVAVGQVGLETPEGLYHLQDKQVDPTWNVPDSDWAGDLAGQSIPPGPSNPLKARWMGIYEGAGIHGTEETSSLGTAASHGCVRMAVPDVEELYDEV